MTTFDERERGFETQWQHDEEVRFRVLSRRNRLLGLWAGHLMGLTVAEAEDYAKTLVDLEVELAGDEPIHDRVEADLRRADVDLSDHRLRKQMASLTIEAHEQVMTEARAGGGDAEERLDSQVTSATGTLDRR